MDPATRRLKLADSATALRHPQARPTAPLSSPERTGWSPQAYVKASIKASNTGVQDYFGVSVALSEDGNRWPSAPRGEDSSATGIDGPQDDLRQGILSH